MQIFIVQAEHPTVPGIVLKSFATRAAAVAEAVNQVNLIAGTPAANAENWEAILEGLQEEHGAEHCDVSITEQDVVGATSAASVIAAVRAYNDNLNALEHAPTGDDYNAVVSIVGAAGAPSDAPAPTDPVKAGMLAALAQADKAMAALIMWAAKTAGTGLAMPRNELRALREAKVSTDTAIARAEGRASR